VCVFVFWATHPEYTTVDKLWNCELMEFELSEDILTGYVDDSYLLSPGGLGCNLLRGFVIVCILIIENENCEE